MKKQTAINLLGGTPAKAAQAMGYSSVQAIYMWPDDLPQSTEDKVNGALVRIRSAKKKLRAAKSSEPKAAQACNLAGTAAPTA